MRMHELRGRWDGSVVLIERFKAAAAYSPVTAVTPGASGYTSKDENLSSAA